MISELEKAIEGQDDWDTHWSDLNEEAEINPAQIYRHKLLVTLIIDLMRDRPEINTIIDFGSGQGDFLATLVPRIQNCQVFGFELSRVGVEISRIKTPAASFFQHNMLLDAPEISQLRNKGDLCVCSEVLEHLDEPHIFLRNARHYVADQGFLIATVPSGPMNAFERSIGHRQHFTRESISSLIQSAGFDVIEVWQAGFPFFNLYKIAGVVRGDKVRADAEGVGGGGSTQPLRLALGLFSFLFRFNLVNTRYGWQLVVIARNLA